MKTIIKYSIGIIAFCVLCSCGPKEIDYRVQSDWVYVNNSSHSIRVIGYENFTLDISETYTIHFDSEGPDVVTEESYVAPFHLGATTVVVDENKQYPMPEIADRSNYAVEKLGKRYYKFTYTFTDADFPEE